MAHPAVVSLKQTIDRLLISRISIVPNPYPQIEQVYGDLCSLQEVIEDLDFSRTSLNRKKVDSLDGKIRQTLCEFEDMLESHVLKHLHSQSAGIDHPWILFSVDFEELNQDFDLFIQALVKMKATYRKQVREEDDDDDDEDFVSSRINHFGGNEYSKMVGLSDQFMEIKEMLTRTSRFRKEEISLVGMAGIGKTTLVKKLFQDPLISSHYDTRVFITIGPRYRLEDVLLDILKQVDPHIDDENMKMFMEQGEGILLGLSRMVYESLIHRKYLIVLDDIWNKELILFDSFPDNNNGSQVLMTTRQLRAGETLSNEIDYKIRFLDNKESWQLRREKVFGEECSSCPLELEKAGKKIAEHCEGLPLTIVIVADNLSKADKTSEYWNEVAADKMHSVFVEAYDQISEVLYPSYEYLPQYLKAFFLYMGVFPQNTELTCSKLTNLCVAEGVVELDTYYHLDDAYFGELVINNLFMVRKQS